MMNVGKNSRKVSKIPRYLLKINHWLRPSGSSLRNCREASLLFGRDRFMFSVITQILRSYGTVGTRALSYSFSTRSAEAWSIVQKGVFSSFVSFQFQFGLNVGRCNFATPSYGNCKPVLIWRHQHYPLQFIRTVAIHLPTMFPHSSRSTARLRVEPVVAAMVAKKLPSYRMYGHIAAWFAQNRNTLCGIL